jgi:hypothetical protein
LHLKGWAVDGSDDGASWTEIDRREKNSDLNASSAVKMFAVSRSGSLSKIRSRQIGRNHNRGNCLVLIAFEFFGVVSGQQQEVTDLRGANLRLAAGSRTQEQEMDALQKWHDDLVGQIAQTESRWDEAIKGILQELRTLWNRSKHHLG